MIKLICITDNYHSLYGNIYKGSIILSYDNNSFHFNIYENENPHSFRGSRDKAWFMKLEEWRNQQIDKILNND